MGGRKVIAGGELYVCSQAKTIPRPMHLFQSPSEQSLEFLKPYRIADELFTLLSGEQILIPKYSPTFKRWLGEPLKETFGGKMLLEVEGKPMFAELAIMHLFLKADWQARWVETYAKNKMAPIFLSEWKDDKYKNQSPYAITDKKVLECLSNIAAINNNNYGGCWDVVAWKDDSIIFAESKRQKQDRIKETQINWLTAALAYGLKPENFAMIEWGME
jgi:hypothetical protein